MKNNTITFLLVLFFHCFLYSQATLVGTWQTEGNGTLEINNLLVGEYTDGTIVLKLTANQLPTTSEKATAVSISLTNTPSSNNEVTATMTGQIYQDDAGNTFLEVFYVLGTGADLNNAETLFFKKTSNESPSPTPPPIKISPKKIDSNLIGPWLDSEDIAGLNIIYISDEGQVYATYLFVPEGYDTGFLIKMKGFITTGNTATDFFFSLSGISPLVTEDKKEPFAISLNGIFKSEIESSSYRCLASMNIAHAYGEEFTYSVVSSKGAYFTKSSSSSFKYQTVENTMSAIDFTNNGSANWVSPIIVGSKKGGTENQTLRMALDTGGNFDWVNSTQCTSDVCKINHTQFDPLNSTSFRWVDKVSSIQDWGPWGKAEANLGYDKLNISETNTAVFKEFKLITEFPENPQFDQFLWDGALAVPAYSSGGKPGDINATIDNIVIDLVTNGVIDPDKVYVSFSYDRLTGEGRYVIGSDLVDSKVVDVESKITLAQDEYVDTDIPEDPTAVAYLWTTALNSVKVGGQEISRINPNITRFSFDTGSSALKGDTISMKEVLGYIGLGSPNIEYNMGLDNDGNHGRFVLTSNQYKRKIEYGLGKGETLVQVQPLEGLPNLWLQGTTLLEDLYSVFKYKVSFNAKGDLVLNAQEVNLYNIVNGPQIIQKQQQLCKETVSNFPHTDSFESNSTATWTQSTDDDINWTYKSGSTLSRNTGPSNASHGDTYAYIESSNPNFNKTAILESPCYDVRGLKKVFFNFNYHMYGNKMGSLKLEVSNDGGILWMPLWDESENQGNQWYQHSAEIDPQNLTSGNLKFRFVGKTGIHYTSDIAIDAIEVSNTPRDTCNKVISSFPHTDSFESYSIATWTQSTDDDINWIYKSGSTPSKKTGPSNASEGFSYAYVEASRNYNKTAILESPCYDVRGLKKVFFNFNYHMYGRYMGRLKLEVSKDGGTKWRGLWYTSRNKGNQWKQQTVEIHSRHLTSGKLKFRFVGRTGRSYTSDIAIDDIQITEYKKIDEYGVLTTSASKSSSQKLIVAQEDFGKEIRMYPNPVTSSLQIVVPNLENTSGDSSISITNILGKVLERYPYQASQPSLNIDLSHLSPGVYFVKISNLNGETIKKIVKSDN